MDFPQAPRQVAASATGGPSIPDGLHPFDVYDLPAAGEFGPAPAGVLTASPLPVAQAAAPRTPPSIMSDAPQLDAASDDMWGMMRMLFRSHPWHGVSIGANAPWHVTVYVEIVPTDTCKFELDKESGHLKIDRPQKYSNVSPTLYGFIPQTYCGARVANLCMERTGRKKIDGDGDPLDICVLTEKPIARGDFLLQAVPIGGLRMIDGDEADDKIIAVMRGDALYGDWIDIKQCSIGLVERLRHYFLTYKTVPGAASSDCVVTDVYGQQEAFEVIRRSQEDYRDKFGGVEAMFRSVVSASSAR